MLAMPSRMIAQVLLRVLSRKLAVYNAPVLPKGDVHSCRGSRRCESGWREAPKGRHVKTNARPTLEPHTEYVEATSASGYYLITRDE